MKHYKFGSSTASRTNACPGWQRESEGIPRTSSQYAHDGTAIHYLLEMLALGDPIADMEGKPVAETPITYTAGHIERAHEMWTLGESFLAEYGVTAYEPEVTGEVNEQVGGTIDLVADTPSCAILLDWKTGQGHMVDPIGNDQILFTAWAALKNSSAQDILQKHSRYIGVIVQPNTRGLDAVRTWKFDRAVVEAFGEHHEKMIAVAGTPDAPLAAGEHCAFCPARVTCPERSGRALTALTRPPEAREALAEYLGLLPDLRRWIKDVEDAAREQLEIGAEVPGYKLVAARPTRRWVDEDAAIEALRRKVGGLKALTDTKIKTPAQVEKLLKEKHLDLTLMTGLVESVSKSTAIVPESDKRPAVLSATAYTEALKTLN